MNNRIPDYLKLHIEETNDTSSAVNVPEFELLCAAFPAATGCRIDVQAIAAADDQLTFPWLEPATTRFQVLVETTGNPGFQKVQAKDTSELAGALTELLNKLGRTRQALRCREAELAAAVPVVSVSQDGQHLADRLEAVLRGAADMLQCFGAGLYLLDEATTCLKLRSQHGLDEQSLTQPARRLEDAIADIEAMAGHAVVVEDALLLSHWNIPAACGSAMCVPVSSPTTILGTLWFFHEHSRDFNPAEQNLAEITAGRLASDLERHVLMQEIRQLRPSPPNAVPCSAWLAGRSPRVPPIVDGWDVAELCTSSQLDGDFCHWHVAANDVVHLTVGAAHNNENHALSTIAFQAALAAHVQHNPNVAELFREMNQSLWTSSARGEPVSLFHAKLDSTSGALNYGLLGNVHAYVLRPHGWEPLLSESGLLGLDCATQLQVRHQVLMPGDVLMAISSRAPAGGHLSDSDMNQMAEQLLRNTHLPAHELAELATRSLGAPSGGGDGLTVLVAKRDETARP